MALVVVIITGVMLVWKKEYLWVSIPEARELPAEPTDRNRVLADAVKSILAAYESNEVRFVQFYSEGLSIHKVFLADKRYAWHSQEGEQIQVWTSNERFEDWLLDLHHRLLLGNTWGLNTVGFAGIFLLISMMLGLVIWWPWRRSYKVKFMPNNGKAGQLRKTHFDTGVSILLPATLIAITGVVLVYPSESRHVLADGFSDPKEPITSTVPMNWRSSVDNDASLDQVQYADSSFRDWYTAFEFTSASFPSSQIRWFSPPTAESENYSVGISESESWNRMGGTSISFQSNGTAILKRQTEQPTMVQALNYAYPLHVGKFPIWYRLLLSASGILLFWLGLLGCLAFMKRTRASRLK